MASSRSGALAWSKSPAESVCTLAGILSRSIRAGSVTGGAAGATACDGARARGPTAAWRDGRSALRRVGSGSGARDAGLSAARGARRGLGGASGVLAITLISGTETGLSSAKIAPGTISAAKATAPGNHLAIALDARARPLAPPSPNITGTPHPTPRIIDFCLYRRL